MKAKLSPPTIQPFDANRFAVIQELQIAAPVAPAPPAFLPFGVLVIVRNVSAGGQLLRVGGAPSFIAPITGMTLNVNDWMAFDNLNLVLSIIGNGIGGLADCIVLS